MPRELLTVFHLIDARNYSSVKATGLLSAEHLQARAEPATPEAVARWRRHRPDAVMLGEFLPDRSQERVI